MLNVPEFMTIASSILGSAFFAGVAWGRLKSIDRRLASIENLFKLQLKEETK